MSMERYRRMLAAAQAHQRKERAAQYLVTCTDTALGVFANDLSAERERVFLSSLTEPLNALLCVWDNGAIDLPSARVRRALLEKDARNAGAAVYLQGENGISRRRLDQTF